MIESILLLVDHWTVLQIIGILCVSTFLFVMVRAHFDRHSPIDLTDLITEYAGGKRRITMSRFGAFVGLLVGTWAFVFATVSDSLDTSWAGISAFMGVCFGYRVSDSYLKNQRDAATPDNSATVTTETHTTATETATLNPPDKPTKKGK